MLFHLLHCIENESMAADGSNPTGSADSFIGSFISLTSKSDIRYEGLLFHINAQESTIGLKNVRSFGTEGRKKDGPVLPSDKVYEYIFFRGRDIRDLQVISSPPLQSAPAIPDDPAIIQLHYPHPASASTSLPAAGTGSVISVSSNAQLVLPISTIQGSLPLYQPVGNLGSWGSSPSPPNPSVSGLTMPMYWQGFGGLSGGLSNLQQQSLLQPEPGLVESPPLQHQTQYPSMNASISSSPSNFPEFSRPLLPPLSTGSPNATSTLLPPSALQLFPIGQPVALPSNLSPNPMQNNAPTALPTVMLGSTLQLMSPLTASSLDLNTITPPTADKPKSAVGLALPYQTISQLMPSVVGTSSSNDTEVSVPFSVTRGQLLQSNATALSSSHSLQNGHRDIKAVQASTSESLSSDSEEAQESILPLQSPYTGKLNGAALHTRQTNRGYSWGRGNVMHGAALHTHHSNWGRAWGRGNGLKGGALHTHHSNGGHTRGRGNRVSRPVTKFTKDFDFEAMNEKFNKDEVWGHLGKSNKARLKSKEWDEKESDGDDSQVEEDVLPKFEKKPGYVKDEFFDSLSCNLPDRESQRGRANFSEQRKIDTETFGYFQKHRGGRGGRWFGHSFQSRGSYYGRGYVHAGRGPRQTMLSRIT